MVLGCRRAHLEWELE